jgi:uncharacterized protein (TIGR00730 family)
VFCGSRSGNDPRLAAAAELVGRTLAEQGYAVLYGGGNSGLMGSVARAARDAGGYVIGVQPNFLDALEPPTQGLSEFYVVDSMHTRKQMMYEKSDGFLVLPGALGTFDEFFEIYTWAQLGLHGKPVAVLNVDGYYDLLLAFLDQCAERGVLRAEVRQMLLSGTELLPLLAAMNAYVAPGVAHTMKSSAQA